MDWNRRSPFLSSPNNNIIYTRNYQPLNRSQLKISKPYPGLRQRPQNQRPPPQPRQINNNNNNEIALEKTAPDGAQRSGEWSKTFKVLAWLLGATIAVILFFMLIAAFVISIVAYTRIPHHDPNNANMPGPMPILPFDLLHNSRRIYLSHVTTGGNITIHEGIAYYVDPTAFGIVNAIFLSNASLMWSFSPFGDATINAIYQASVMNTSSLSKKSTTAPIITQFPAITSPITIDPDSNALIVGLGFNGCVLSISMSTGKPLWITLLDPINLFAQVNQKIAVYDHLAYAFVSSPPWLYELEDTEIGGSNDSGSDSGSDSGNDSVGCISPPYIGQFNAINITTGGVLWTVYTPLPNESITPS